MIKENKKNKVITFFCACLMVCASAFGLVNSLGSTLATITTLMDTTQAQEYINGYKTFDYESVFDGYFKFGTIFNTTQFSRHLTYYNFDGTTFTISSFPTISNDGSNLGYFLNSINGFTDYQSYITSLNFGSFGNYIKFTNLNTLIMLTSVDYGILSFNYDGVYYNFISEPQYNRYLDYKQGLADADTTSAYNNGVTVGQNNVINNPNNYNLYTEAQYQQNYVNGQNSVINNPNNYGLYTQSQYEQNYTNGYNAGVIQGQNNVINNPNDFDLNTNQQLQDSYNQGFSDGEQSTDAYQNGVYYGTQQGINEVLNNPNIYNLYTETQYQQNYNDGYNLGLQVARYGVFGNYTAEVLRGNVTANTPIEEPLQYHLNGLIFTNNVMQYYSEGSQTSGILTVDITFNNPLIFENDNDIQLFGSDVRSAVLNYTLIDNSGNEYKYTASATTIINENNERETTFTYAPQVIDGNYVTGAVPKGTYITGLFIQFTNPDYFSLSNIYLHENDDSYDLGYELGFDQGFVQGSSLVNKQSYDKGYTEGNRVGYQTGLSDGLNNPDRYTFLGLLTGVVSAPVNVLKDLFDFNLMGFNMLKFFLGCLTAVLILWLVRKVMGGK